MQPKLMRTRMGSLDAAIVQGSDAPPKLAVVLCHGYGAPGEDLVPLSLELMSEQPSLAEAVRFIFPQAPLSLGELGMEGARAWWHLQMDRLLAIQRGDSSGMKRMRDEHPSGLDVARKALRQLVDEVMKTTGLPMGRIVLGGFSQGAMIATDLTLRLEEPPAALAILSGTIICEPEWRKLAPARRGLTVVQSHGRQDPILPYAVAEDLRALLTDAGLSVDFTPFDGGHTIPMEMLQRLGALLARLA